MYTFKLNYLIMMTNSFFFYFNYSFILWCCNYILIIRLSHLLCVGILLNDYIIYEIYALLLVFWGLRLGLAWVSGLDLWKGLLFLLCSSFQDTRMFSLSQCCDVRSQVRRSDCVTVFKDGTIQSRNFLHPPFLRLLGPQECLKYKQHLLFCSLSWA